jgi:subfamily B ATP-binding cassette protein MsbA
VKEAENPVRKAEFSDRISLKDVHFSYADDAVINGISLEIEKGKTIALVGPSGGGKSTLANLITRFYDIDSGAISVDGVPVKDISLFDLRELMGVVTQDSILFNDTIHNNITLGKDGAKTEDVIRAAQIANADEFIKDLPGKYDFNIGDGGTKLSGGQKQRLSIARAIYHNPPILILDEATSALDTHSEKLVQEAINNLMQNRTAVVIAHRLSTIKSADCIYVIKKGEIIEKGSHDGLIAEGGLYKSLVEMQDFS